MEKKYKLTEETIKVDGRILYRIEALKYFGDVIVGEKGGFIESEDNLSQSGNCWIYNNAKVYDDAKVFDDASVGGNAIVCDNAKICGYAKVYGHAIVYGHATVCDDAQVYDNASVDDGALVCGNAKVCGNAEIYGNAVITSNSDYIVFKNWWSSGRHFTWTRSNNMWKVGCFYGTGNELIEKAYKDSNKSGKEYERIVKYVESSIVDDTVDA